jgi:XisI protein
MVGMIKDPIQAPSLLDAVRTEVKRYAGYSPIARLFPLLDDASRTYAVIIIEDDPAARPASVIVMARVVDEKIIIEEDTTDKPLYDALMFNAHIPREQIILAYAGEKVPDEQEKSE